mgnify:CR=1 FL=1
MKHIIDFLNKIWDFFAKRLNNFFAKHPYLNKQKNFIASCFCGFLGALVSYLLLSIVPLFVDMNSIDVDIIPKVEIRINDNFSYYWKFIGFSSYSMVNGKLVGTNLGFIYTILYYLGLFLSSIITLLFMRKYYHQKGGIKLVLKTIFTIMIVGVISNMINNLWLPVASFYLNQFVYNIVVIIISGGINLIVGHFINRFLFDDTFMKRKKRKK